MHSLIELPTNTLLDKFGSGKHAPGSGSAAALMGLLAAKLVVTVGALTLRKPEYRKDHAVVQFVCQKIEIEITPMLMNLFQQDAECFDEVIKARKARDAATDERERRRLGEAALEALKPATEIPFQIGEACLKLIDHAVVVFDGGFKGARGDTGAAVSAAVAGAMSAVFVINLNLRSFRGSAWAKEQRTRCDSLHESLTTKQATALERVMQLRSEDVTSIGLNFGATE